jgi:hypothetical protein
MGSQTLGRCPGVPAFARGASASGSSGTNAGQARTGWRGYFSGSAVHMMKVDDRPWIRRRAAQRWHRLSGKSGVMARPEGAGKKGQGQAGRSGPKPV